MNGRLALLIAAALAFAACSREQPAVDPQLAAAISGIRAIDNHAHPVLAAAGDREFDALPVDNMEPQSDPVAMRPGAFRTPFTAESKAAAKREHGDGYPAWDARVCEVATIPRSEMVIERACERSWAQAREASNKRRSTMT